MNRLINTSVFEIFNSSSNIDQAVIQQVLDEFSTAISQLADSDGDYKTTFRTLAYTQTMLDKLRVKAHLDEALEIATALVENEIELLQFRITHAKMFSQTAIPAKSPLVLSPEVKLSDIMELLVSLDALDLIQFSDGSKASFAKLTESIEWLFNISFGNCYEKRDDILIRKRQKTKFLDKLKAALEEHNKNNFTPNR